VLFCVHPVIGSLRAGDAYGSLCKYQRARALNSGAIGLRAACGAHRRTARGILCVARDAARRVSANGSYVVDFITGLTAPRSMLAQ
jgi:hypothetical protein